MFDTLASFWADVAKAISSRFLFSTVDAYSDLHSVDSPFAFATTDGSLLSVISIRGVSGVVGDEEYERLHGNLARMLTPFMREHGHLLQWAHFDDPELLPEELDRMFEPYVQKSKHLGLDFEDIFAERKKRMAPYCSTEWTYLAVRTFGNSLSPHELRRLRRERELERKERQLRNIDTLASLHTQSVEGRSQPLKQRHASLVKRLLNELAQLKDSDGIGFLVSVMDTDEAASVVRATFDAALPTPVKLASVDVEPIIRATTSPNDDRGLLPPLVREQLFLRTAVDHGVDIVRIGAKYFATVTVQVGPMDRLPFDRLVAACKGAGKGMGWRICINFIGAGFGKLFLRNIGSKFLGFSDENKPIQRAFNELEKLAHAGHAVIGVQISASTWADDESTARFRGAALARAIQTWGVCTPSDFSGDSIFDAMASVGAATCESPANWTALPLTEATKLVPMRPSSPWDAGCFVLRTADGRLMPLDPGQGVQQVAVEVAVGPPGYGKSALMNAKHFAGLLSLRALSLPYLSIIDVGPSSQGLIEQFRDRLPPDRRHLAQYAKIRNDPADTRCRINPFDTHLGFRKPIARDRSTMVNILATLFTPVGGVIPEEGVELASAVVDALFKRYCSVGTLAAKVYEPTVSEQVAAAIARRNLSLPQRATWWEVVDILFDAGEFECASVAQRFAVPTLPDVLLELKSREIATVYGESSGLVDKAYRMVQSGINDFPIMASPTTFDVSTSRIVSFDLDEVARGTDDMGRKQAALCYNLIFGIATRRFNLRNDDLLADCVPERYLTYWRRVIFETTSAPMQLSFDEFHRVAPIAAMERQVGIEAREGRKRGVNVMMATQSPTDVPRVIAEELATGLYILGGPPGLVKEAARCFSLSATEQLALERYCHGPSADGSTLLAVHQTKRGRSSQLLTLTLGPLELWAYSTTPEDTRLRARLVEALGSRQALKALSLAYPGGSAKDQIERRERVKRETFGGNADVIGEIAGEVIERFRNST